jgi:hypothetical protein
MGGILPQEKRPGRGAKHRSSCDDSLPERGVDQFHCDHALPSSSCFFLASASMRILAEHSSQIVLSDGLPQVLQTCMACSGLTVTGFVAFT